MDSRAVLGAVSKGRSSSRRLNFGVRWLAFECLSASLSIDLLRAPSWGNGLATSSSKCPFRVNRACAWAQTAPRTLVRSIRARAGCLPSSTTVTLKKPVAPSAAHHRRRFEAEPRSRSFFLKKKMAKKMSTKIKKSKNQKMKNEKMSTKYKKSKKIKKMANKCQKRQKCSKMTKMLKKSKN